MEKDGCEDEHEDENAREKEQKHMRKPRGNYANIFLRKLPGGPGVQNETLEASRALLAAMEEFFRPVAPSSVYFSAPRSWSIVLENLAGASAGCNNRRSQVARESKILVETS